MTHLCVSLRIILHRSFCLPHRGIILTTQSLSTLPISSSLAFGCCDFLLRCWKKVFCVANRFQNIVGRSVFIHRPWWWAFYYILTVELWKCSPSHSIPYTLCDWMLKICEIYFIRLSNRESLSVFLAVSRICPQQMWQSKSSILKSTQKQ